MIQLMVRDCFSGFCCMLLVVSSLGSSSSTSWICYAIISFAIFVSCYLSDEICLVTYCGLSNISEALFYLTVLASSRMFLTINLSNLSTNYLSLTHFFPGENSVLLIRELVPSCSWLSEGI